MRSGIRALVDYDRLATAFMVANTPRYLYAQFRQIDSVSRLAQDWGKEWLLQEYDRLTSKPTLGVDDTVIAYAIIVAFTFLDYASAKEALDRVDVTRLRWAKDIREMFTSAAEPTGFLASVNTPGLDARFIVSSGTADTPGKVVCAQR